MFLLRFFFSESIILSLTSLNINILKLNRFFLILRSLGNRNGTFTEHRCGVSKTNLSYTVKEYSLNESQLFILHNSNMDTHK